MLSFTGMGTLSSSFCSSSFSSCHEKEKSQGQGGQPRTDPVWRAGGEHPIPVPTRDMRGLTSLTVMFLNSEDNEKTRKSSISLRVGFSSWL